MPILALMHAIAIALSTGFHYTGNAAAMPFMWCYVGGVAVVHLLPWLPFEKPATADPRSSGVDATESVSDASLEPMQQVKALVSTILVAGGLIGLVLLMLTGEETTDGTPALGGIIGVMGTLIAYLIAYGPDWGADNRKPPE